MFGRDMFRCLDGLLLYRSRTWESTWKDAWEGALWVVVVVDCERKEGGGESAVGKRGSS